MCACVCMCGAHWRQAYLPDAQTPSRGGGVDECVVSAAPPASTKGDTARSSPSSIPRPPRLPACEPGGEADGVVDDTRVDEEKARSDATASVSVSVMIARPRVQLVRELGLPCALSAYTQEERRHTNASAHQLATVLSCDVQRTRDGQRAVLQLFCSRESHAADRHWRGTCNARTCLAPPSQLT